jgi:hypothetical protein
MRERCSCAISSRSTPSPAFQSLLSPLFPLLPGNSPVSPFFPLLTQKQGGRGYEEAKDVNEVEHHLLLLTHAFTTTLINIVGAPTFPLLHGNAAMRGDPVGAGLQPCQRGMTKVMRLQQLGMTSPWAGSMIRAAQGMRGNDGENDRERAADRLANGYVRSGGGAADWCGGRVGTGAEACIDGVREAGRGGHGNATETVGRRAGEEDERAGAEDSGLAGGEQSAQAGAGLDACGALDGGRPRARNAAASGHNAGGRVEGTAASRERRAARVSLRGISEPGEV